MTWTNNGWYVKSSFLVGTGTQYVLFNGLILPSIQNYKMKQIWRQIVKVLDLKSNTLHFILSQYASIDFVTNEADTVR